MKLGRTYPLDFTHEELLLLGYNMIGIDTMRELGIDSSMVKATNEIMTSLRAKIKEQLRRAGTLAVKADKDKIWRTIGDASKQ